MIDQTKANARKLRICMLLPLRYGSKATIVYPNIEIMSYLAHFGHEVTWVIAAEKHHPPQQHLHPGIKVHTVDYHRYFPEDSVWGKILNQIPYLFRRTRLILRIFREEEYDLVFVRNSIPDSFSATYIKRRYKIPFVIYLPNPLEQPSKQLKLDPRKPRALYYVVAKLREFADAHLVSKADLILTVSKWLQEQLIGKGYSESKVVPAPTGVAIEVFSERDGINIRQRYNLHDSKVIMYVGTLSKARCLSFLIKAFSIAKTKVENIKLLMVGEGSDRQYLEKLANSLGIKHDIIFTGQVPRDEVPDFIAAADIGVSPVPPFPIYKYSSPIKMFEYMAGYKPVVANEEIPEHKEVLEESGGGILTPFIPEVFADAIIELLEDPKKATEMGSKGREWVAKNRNYEVLARQVEERYFSLIEAKHKKSFNKVNRQK
jgi:glycosyltransferase involved in cell wall biosynthesis